eukprot:m.30709 g.30709  ORF g.30709 m.30709 type:complete len:373 (+) comp31381_c0_seq2:105-1223(+)
MGAGCSSRRQISVSANDFPSFKIVLVGDSEVGKTSIFMRYVRNQFDYSYHPTVSVCIGNVVKKVNIPRDVIVSVAIWDLPGREEIDLRKSYYRNVDAAIVVVDVGSTDSIESASMWKQDVLSNASLSSRDSTGEEIPGDGFRCPLAIAVPVLLMGNKFDKLDYDPESGIVPDGVTALEKYADDNGFAGCVTVSARDSDGSVHNAVQALIRHLVEMKVTRHGLTRQSTQPMEGLKRIGMLNRTKEVKERLMATRIAEFDTLFSQSEPCLDDIDSSAAGFHGALSRFRRQCAVCGVGVGVHPSLEDCITALKEALGDTRLEARWTWFGCGFTSVILPLRSRTLALFHKFLFPRKWINTLIFKSAKQLKCINSRS